MKRYKTVKTANCKPVHIAGTSETIPGLAPDIQTLLAAAIAGEPLPSLGTPRYDDSDEAGIARVGVGDLPPEEILTATQTAQAEPAQAAEGPDESASSKEDDKERSDAKDD